MTKKAEPKFNIMDRVTYLDHHKRVVAGRIKSIEAHWSGWGRDPNVDPLIIYTVEHPSYRNHRMYVGEPDLIGLGAAE